MGRLIIKMLNNKAMLFGVYFNFEQPFRIADLLPSESANLG
jgi:hypothetical protein